jgi:hypothetical protein
VRRWWRRRKVTQRAQLADDVRRVAGYADAAAERARRLGAQVPDGVAACATVWWAWHRRLAEWVWSEPVRPRREKMSSILPTPRVRTPAFSSASSTVGPEARNPSNAQQ